MAHDSPRLEEMQWELAELVRQDHGVRHAVRVDSAVYRERRVADLIRLLNPDRPRPENQARVNSEDSATTQLIVTASTHSFDPHQPDFVYGDLVHPECWAIVRDPYIERDRGARPKWE